MRDARVTHPRARREREREVGQLVGRTTMDGRRSAEETNITVRWTFTVYVLSSQGAFFLFLYLREVVFCFCVYISTRPSWRGR